MYKTFDWDFCEKIRHPLIFSFLKENHTKPVTEAEFVEAWSKIPKEGQKNWSHRYGPASARAEYRILRKKFGFFPV